MSYPIEKVRAQFPSLERQYHGKKIAYFDGPGGSQVAQSVLEASRSYMRNGVANLHGPYPTSQETEKIAAQARKAVSDLIGTHPEEIAFGANMTTLTFSVARALARQWRGEGEIVVTELDHRANVDPWLSAAEDFGLKIKWIEVDPERLTLKTDQLDEIITEKTKLVAVGLASNAVGAINDVREIVRHAKKAGAFVAVDAVHAVPHFAVDMNELGVDLLFCSAYKFFGPHVGIAAIRKEIFEPLRPYKLQPAPKDMPDKLETGTQNFEGLAGVIAAVDVIAGLGEGETRRERIVSGYANIEGYENRLAVKLREGLRKIDRVHLYDPSSRAKTPTVSFRIEGEEPEAVCRYLVEEHGIFIASGDFYASTLAEKLAIAARGGWIRAGLAPYNTEEEIDRLIQGVARLAEKTRS
ncbi:MAG TPA: cysteine desulfurase-like protein [Bacillales bacterium]|nr:cysteine desulfurase-like protein [Bacillales bacterium]